MVQIIATLPPYLSGTFVSEFKHCRRNSANRSSVPPGENRTRPFPRKTMATLELTGRQHHCLVPSHFSSTMARSHGINTIS